jgi:hypothetical protein
MIRFIIEKIPKKGYNTKISQIYGSRKPRKQGATIKVAYSRT